MWNGTISSHSSSGVWIVGGGSFTMENGTITGNSHSIGGGGGVSVFNTGSSFTMKGGTISANTSRGLLDGTTAGGGVLVSSGGTFTMQGGTISGNQTRDTPASPGGGVGARSGGVFSKTGGTIYGTGAGADSNNCSAGAAYGHAVYYDDGPLYRDTTLTTGDNLSTSDTTTNWGM